MKTIRNTAILTLAFFLGLTASVMAAAPSAPENAVSTSHGLGNESVKNQITVVWDAATDPDGDLSGYAISWNTSPDSDPWTKVTDASTTNFTTPELTDGSYYIHIRAVDDQANYSDTAHIGPFIIKTQILPSISSITPDTGSDDAVTNVIISGTNFVQGATVKIGDTDMTDVERISPEKLGASVPSGLDAGIYDIRVTNPDGESVVKADFFTVISSGSQPVSADAGMDRFVLLSKGAVNLEGDAEPSTGWTYNWTMTKKPSESDATLIGNDTLTPSFTPDQSGRYVIRFSVIDAELTLRASDTVAVTVYRTENLDADGNDTIEVKDAILALQILMGVDPEIIKAVVDVDSDGRIGMAEIISVLRILSSPS